MGLIDWKAVSYVVLKRPMGLWLLALIGDWPMWSTDSWLWHALSPHNSVLKFPIPNYSFEFETATSLFPCPHAFPFLQKQEPFDDTNTIWFWPLMNSNSHLWSSFQLAPTVACDFNLALLIFQGRLRFRLYLHRMPSWCWNWTVISNNDNSNFHTVAWC